METARIPVRNVTDVQSSWFGASIRVRALRRAGRCIMAMLLAICTSAAAAEPSVVIKADREAVDMGHSVTLEAQVTLDNGQPGAGYLLLPYVNERRWGSHETTNEQGRAKFLLPLPNPGAARIQVVGRPGAGTLSQWIWAGLPKDNQTIHVQKTFTVDKGARRAVLRVAVDDRCEVFLNGRRLGTAAGWQQPAIFGELEKQIREGANTLSIAASNGTGPAGIMARTEIETDAGPMLCQTDASWQAWLEPPAGWPGAAGAPGAAATVVAAADGGAWAGTVKDWPGVTPKDNLMAGRLITDDGLKSNRVEVEVKRRALAPREPSDRLVCVQWEPWFTPQNAYWQTAQAVPVVGLYDSYNRDVVRQHILWFVDLGIDFIMPDWSNHIWEKQHWDERPDGANEIIHATSLLLEALADIRTEGIPVPKVVLMPGLTNGPPTTMTAMNEQLQWVYHAWMRNPRFAGLWQDYDGKPLVVILDTGLLAPREKTPVDDAHYTVRWMSTQLQINTKHQELGYWSWMDGSLRPIVTYRDGKPEAVTVTPAYFAEFGWTGPKARGRRGGTTYIESFKAAIEEHPRVVQLHQWNEYAGQPEGQGCGPDHDRYVDSYSVELSDDLEPVSLTAPGYRGDKGGWGFYYLNLTRALLDLYRGKAPHDTLLAVGSPLANSTATGPTLDVEWSVVGVPPTSYTVDVDGKTVADAVKETTFKLPLEGLAPGPHKLSVTANGATTRYPLSATRMDTPLDAPIPVRVQRDFVVKNSP